MPEPNKNGLNMLEGSIVDKLFIFAIPLALTTFFQQLLNTADVLISGKYIGTNAMAAIGNNTPIVSLIVSLFVGLSIGANVVIARHIGSRQFGRIKMSISTAILTAIISGLSVMLLAEFLVDTSLDAMGVPSEVREMTETYLRFFLLGMPGISLYNFAAAIIRSRGDTRTPLYSLLIASVLNLILDLLAVQVFGMGIDGIAGATSIANYANAFYLLYSLSTTKDILHVHIYELRQVGIDYREIRRMIAIGLPAGIQGMVFSVSNLIIQSAINSLGADAMAASAAGFSLEINVYTFMNAFGQATTTFVSQNFGAHNLPRCFRITKLALIVETLVTLGLSALTLIFSRELLMLFSTDERVIELATIRLWYIVAPYILNGSIEILSGALRGYGISMPPAIVTLICVCGVRIIWVYTVFAADPTYENLMITYGISWAFTTALLAVIYIYFKRRLADGRHLGINQHYPDSEKA